MNDAMADVRHSQEMIIAKGGVPEWKEMRLGDKEEHEGFAKWFTGPKNRRSGAIDINGNDISYRSAKVRLLNLVHDFNEMSVLELAYDAAPPPGSIAQDAEEKAEQTAHGATNAVALYNTAAEQGDWKKLEEGCTEFARKRGRTFEHLYFGKDSSEILEMEEDQKKLEKLTNEADDAERASKRPRLSPEPRPRLELRKRKNQNATVSFDRFAYQRKEADVDELRWDATPFSVNFLEDETHTVSAPKVLRTAVEIVPETEITPAPARKVNPPKAEHVVHRINDFDGSSRRTNESRWLHPMYTPGKWSVLGDIEYVDTSGSSLRKYTGSWDEYEEYVGSLQEEAKEMDKDTAVTRARDLYDGESGDETEDEETVEIPPRFNISDWDDYDESPPDLGSFFSPESSMLRPPPPKVVHLPEFSSTAKLLGSYSKIERVSRDVVPANSTTKAADKQQLGFLSKLQGFVFTFVGSGAASGITSLCKRREAFVKVRSMRRS
jgi:hypothetical protein